jgi:hypothetical protein
MRGQCGLMCLSCYVSPEFISSGASRGEQDIIQSGLSDCHSNWLDAGSPEHVRRARRTGRKRELSDDRTPV